MSSRALLLFLIIVCLYPLRAQDVTFRHLAVEDGLSQNTINCIYQDHYGFMWFGTQDGLNSYDGFKFTVYRSNPEDSSTLSHNWIWDVMEDDAHRLWIATWNGLSKYDRSLGTFETFLPDSSDASSISGTRPASLAKDLSGKIWVGIWGGGLNLLDPETGSFLRYRKLEDPGQGYPGDYVRKLCMDSGGRLWIGTWNGLWRCRLLPDGEVVFEHFLHDPADPSSISSNRITSFREDAQGEMWIGTLGGGLNRYDSVRHCFVQYQSDPDQAGSLSSNDITSIERSGDGRLWIATVSGGLNHFDPETGLFRRYGKDPADPGSLGSNNVYAVYADRGHVLWVGAGGLNIFNPRLFRFNPTGPLEAMKEQMKGHSVYALLEDSRGDIWVGTNHSGLARFQQQTGQVSWYRHRPGDSNSISHNSVSSLAEDPEGNIWISTAGGGLNKLDPRSEKWKHFGARREVVETAGMDNISGIVVDNQGLIWIATAGEGIISFHPGMDHYRSYRNDANDPASLSGNYLLRIFMDSHGDIWVGTWGAGLNRIDREGDGFIRYMGNPADLSTLPDNIVHSISEEQTDSCRVIWVGTAGGLASFDPDHPEAGFKRSPVNDQLPSQSVYGILSDGKNRRWISTNAGISCYQLADSALKHYTHRDGLPGNEYNAGASLGLGNGLLAFGGIGGLLLFHPDSVTESSYHPPLALTSFSVLNRQVYEGIELNAMEEIKLSFRQNFFSFEFASMDFADPRNNRFRYKMEGIDEEWIVSGDRHFASYTKIDPGDYLFRVQGTNSDGRYSNHEVSIAVLITPPFWQRWWFRGLVAVIVIMAFYAFLHYRIQRVREIERLRTRIASDLHDDIGSSLTRISVHSQQILAQKDPDRIRLSTEQIGELSRDTISTMSDIVWSIDARNDTLADFLGRMQDLTHSLLSEKDISVSFKHSGMDSRRMLRVELRQNLYYIFKEAIHNIARHSGADRVEISIHNMDSHFHMLISDNGNGYDPVSVKGGNGLKNMKMRAGRIGASLTMAVDGGVVIELKMKGL